jgi:hypothetical protein
MHAHSHALLQVSPRAFAPRAGKQGEKEGEIGIEGTAIEPPVEVGGGARGRGRGGGAGCGGGEGGMHMHLAAPLLSMSQPGNKATPCT